MGTKKIVISIAALLLVSSSYAAELSVQVLGPGGHSSGNYGNTSAVHAAARAVAKIHEAVPDAVITDMNGGASVNAIAADASFKVKVQGTEAEVNLIKKAVFAGCDEENSFRGVTQGEVRNGLRKDIRCTVQ